MIAGVVKSASAHRPIPPAAVEVPTTGGGTPRHVRVLEQPIQSVVEDRSGRQHGAKRWLAPLPTCTLSESVRAPEGQPGVSTSL